MEGGGLSSAASLLSKRKDSSQVPSLNLIYDNDEVKYKINLIVREKKYIYRSIMEIKLQPITLESFSSICIHIFSSKSIL